MRYIPNMIYHPYTHVEIMDSLVQVLGEPKVEIRLIDFCSDSQSNSDDDDNVFISINLLMIFDVPGGGRGYAHQSSFVPLGALTEASIARIVPAPDILPFLAEEIVSAARHMGRHRPWVGPAVLRMEVKVVFLVDRIPGDGEEIPIPFVPTSQESIEGLERVVVDSSSLDCPVCLEEIPVGSEAVRMPCSHRFHGDCIVKWLHNSKLCPICRFQMPAITC